MAGNSRGACGRGAPGGAPWNVRSWRACAGMQWPPEQAHAMVVFHRRQRRPLMVINSARECILWRNGGLKMVTIDRYLVTIRPDKRHGTCVVLIWSLLDQ